MKFPFVTAILLIYPAVFATGWAADASTRSASPLPKQIFAHYMGCWPTGSGALHYAKHTEWKTLRHDSKNKAEQRGGHVRNWDLLPFDMKLTLEESADLEIRRALRIGIDGFAIDAWAGDKNAKATLDALFKVAEEKNYPFQITVCLDPACGGRLVETVQYLLEKHGASPKLARRDGKPLIFGYMSAFLSNMYLKQTLPDKTDAEYQRLRASPEGWEIMGSAFEDASKQLGQPIYWHFCMSAFFHRVKPVPAKEALPQAAGIIAKHVQAIGGFGGSLGGEAQPEIAKIVKKAGAEWSAPLGMFQKENIPYENYADKGIDTMCAQWAAVRDQDATLLQLITWNDYGENSNIAPAYNTRYSVYDLTGYFINWWKTGKEPTPDHDRVYLIYRKYPSGVKVFPFKQGPYLDGVLEVVTILPQKATVRLPGRNAEYEAPAGFSRKQFPITPGPVAAELYRSGNQVLRLESPEPITDHPFREDNAMVCYSSEEDLHWKADFGNVTPFQWSEYGDVNQNGLPNWFEMYWFGHFGDLSTATASAAPNTLAANGKTLLECYQQRLNPSQKPISYTEIPTDGLVAWYRADQGVERDEKGLVSVWRDQSPNKLDLYAKTDEEKPRFLKHHWNQLPAIELNGIKNRMSCLFPKNDYPSMTALVVFAAKASDQICRTQEGKNNRVISIPIAKKADYEGGLIVGVNAIAWWPEGDVAINKQEFSAADRPSGIGLGYMAFGEKLANRGWNAKGIVAEILLYSPALTDEQATTIISILKTRYDF